MRRVVGAIALLLLLLFLALLIPFPAGQPQEDAGAGEIAPSQMLLRSAEIADAGWGAAGTGAGAAWGDAGLAGTKVAVLRLSVFSDSPRNVTAFCSPLPIQKNVLILDFPSVPGSDPSLAPKISTALSQSGISSRPAGMKDALTSENTLIISPSGAIPLPLLEEAQALQKANCRVVALVALQGKTIDANGNIAPTNGSLPPIFEEVGLRPSGSLEAAQQAARLALMPSQAEPVRALAAGNFTIAVPINSSFACCRAIMGMGDGKARPADSGQLEAPGGLLLGPSRLAAGEQGAYEFSLLGSGEVGRALRFFASAHSASGEEYRREIAGGEIKEGWASRLQLSFPSGGKYVVRITDQFGRQHAAAYVAVPMLEVLPVSEEGSRYEFLALLDGEPASGAISARLDNGTPRNYSLQGGRLVLWAAPSSGSHTLHFSLSGSGADYEFTAQQSGAGALLDTYVRFGVPAAIFVLAVFLLLRAGRRSKYSITFPEQAPCEPLLVPASASELLAAYKAADRKFGGFSLPCYAHEIASALSRAKGQGLNQHSVLCVLRRLCEQGVFAEHESAFIPSALMGGFSAKELCMLRAIHEAMLERGLRFSRKPVIAVRKNGLELALFRGKASVLAGMGKACRAVVFESEEEIRAFHKGLSEPLPENSRTRLALGNDKVIFVPATRAGLLGILP